MKDMKISYLLKLIIIRILIISLLVVISLRISHSITGPQYIISSPINFTVFDKNFAYANSTINVGEIYGINEFSLSIGGENFPVTVYASTDNKTWIKINPVIENTELVKQILPSFSYRGVFSNLGKSFETKKDIDIFFMSEIPEKESEGFVVYQISVLGIFERPLSFILFFTVLFGLIKIIEFIIPEFISSKNKK